MTKERRGPLASWPTRLLSLLAASLAVLASVYISQALPTAAASTTTVNASEDSYVRSDQPDANFGAKYTLEMQAGSDTTPTQISYIKFVVNGMTSQPASVQLRLFSYARSDQGLQLFTSSSDWAENTITYNSRPMQSTTLAGNVPSISLNAWSSADVSGVVTGNGTYTFVVTTPTTAAKHVASRESTANPPQLLIDTASTPSAVSAASGSGQTATTGTDFAAPLVAAVTDATGAAVPGVPVTFTAPASGPTATFAGGSSAVTVTTDANGQATSPPLTAGAPGSYAVLASAAGITQVATFTLTNGDPAPPATDPSTSTPADPSGSTPTDPSSSTPTDPASTDSSTAAASPPASDPPTSSGSATSAAPSSSGVPTTTTTLKPTADTYVDSSQATSNFGTSYTLRAEAPSASTPNVISFLRFDLSSLSGTVSSASFQLYSYATTPLGVSLSTATGNWDERSVTYQNAPTVGPVVATVPNIALNTWLTGDVTSAVAAAVGSQSTITLAVTTTRTANNKFASREASGTPPKLVVTTSASGSTPSSTPSSPPTSSTPPSSSVPPPSSSTPTTTSSAPGSTLAITGPAGDGQTVMVGASYPVQLTARVADGQSPVVGASVTFTAPASGPSVTFAGNRTATVATDSTGTATAPVMAANMVSGTFTVTATTPGATKAASYTLTNRDPIVVAAGDIACKQGSTVTASSCQQMATSNLALSLHPDAVLPLGDDQYELGALSDYSTSYDASWGRLNSIAYPAPGNHEYGYIGTDIQPTGGTGYFTYFGDRSHPLQPGCTTLCKSWYSFNVGSWHIISLDSQCAVIGGCNPGNPEYNWLLSDLNANSNACTLAYWHIPIYASSTDRQPDMQAIYQLLYTKHADLILNGHAHYYERFGPQDGAGNSDPVNGIPEFVVGTGGRNFFPMSATPRPNSIARITNTFGVLELSLSSQSFSWQFVPTNAGGSTDSGTANCH